MNKINKRIVVTYRVIYAKKIKLIRNLLINLFQKADNLIMQSLSNAVE